MYFYFILNVLVIFGGIFCPKIIFAKYSERKKKAEVPLQCLLLFGILLVFLGFRGDFTSDYKNYSAYFEKICTSVSVKDVFVRSFSMEKGFILISKFIGFFTHSEPGYHLILSAGMLFLFFRMFWKKSNIFWLTILLFVNLGDYFGSMNLFRQVLAAAIVFSGFKFLEEKKFFRFSLVVLLTATIHTSALIMLGAYFLLIRKRRLPDNVIFIGVGLGIWFLIDPIVNLITLIPAFSKYQDYHYGMGAGSINAIWVIAVIYFFAVVSIKIFTVGFDEDDTLNVILLNGTFLCMLFLILGVKVYMFTRFAYFFRPFACLLIPKVLAHYENKNTRNILICMISVMCILYTQITLSGTGYDPYYFYWSGV